MANSKLSALAISSPRGTPDRANDVIYVVKAGVQYGSTVNNELGISGNPVGDTDSQTLTNKTFTSPTITGPVFSGTLTGTYTLGGTPTFPASVVTLTGTQVLTNKTLTAATLTSPTLTNASITQDAVVGFTTANSGTVYGITVTAGVITSASVGTSAIVSGIQLPDKMKNPYKFRVYRVAALTASTTDPSSFAFDTKSYDTGTNYSTATGLFTAPVTGFYMFTARISHASASAFRLLTYFYKNGAIAARGADINSAFAGSTIADVLSLTVGDTVEVRYVCGSTPAFDVGTVEKCYFSGFLISAT